MEALLRRPLTWIALGVLAGVAIAGLWWFQPWKALTTNTVNDALPTIAAAPSSPTDSPGPGATTANPGNRVLAEGSFVSHEHQTNGTAKLVRLADGQDQLLLVGLETSDGPDLRVWLTDQPVTKDGSSFDDGKYLELGRLKGNRGNQVYAIPSGMDLTTYRSVTIWCKRFAVSFGAAELHPI